MSTLFTKKNLYSKINHEGRRFKKVHIVCVWSLIFIVYLCTAFSYYCTRPIFFTSKCFETQIKYIAKTYIFSMIFLDVLSAHHDPPLFYWDLLVSCGALPKARLAHTPKLKFKMSYVSRLDLFLAGMRRIEYELLT